MRIHFIIFLVILIVSSGCDNGGLNPDSFQEPGFSGTLTFTGPIPPADSLIELRIVSVPYYPVDSTFAELFDKIVNKGIIPFSENLKDKAIEKSSVEYRFSVKPQNYYYIAVVQLYGPDILSQWKVVGIHGYSHAHPQPASVMVKDGAVTTDVDIEVDFYNLPIQPFKVP